MTSWKQLSRSLRVAIAAPWVMFVAFVAAAATPSFRQLLLDSSNNPTTTVSLSGSNWSGTLPAARLPGSVPLLDGSNNLTLPAGLTVDGPSALDDGAISTDGVGDASFFGTVQMAGLGVAGGPTSLDYGTVSTDGAGDLSANSLSISGPLYGSGGQEILDDFGDFAVIGTASVGGETSLDGGLTGTDGDGGLTVGNYLSTGGNVYIGEGLTFNAPPVDTDVGPDGNGNFCVYSGGIIISSCTISSDGTTLYFRDSSGATHAVAFSN